MEAEIWVEIFVGLVFELVAWLNFPLLDIIYEGPNFGIGLNSGHSCFGKFWQN